MKSQQLKASCATRLLGTPATEVMRYIRVHVADDADDNSRMKNQFLRDTTRVHLCSEYKAGGVHTLGIFPDQKHVVRSLSSIYFEALDNIIQ